MSKNNVESIITNVERIIKGKTDIIELLLVGLLSGGHILLEDVPGVGKTSLANSLAKSIDCSFSRIQFTPDTLPSDITGVSIYDMNQREFEYHKGPIFHNIILADEINRTSPKTQASLLEAMEEGTVTIDGITYTLPKPFMVIATQNPLEHLGTYHLPEAQIDRFLMKLSIGYPSYEAERDMIEAHKNKDIYKTLEAIVTSEDIVTMQQEVEKVTIHRDLTDYIISIIRGSRETKDLTLGASPRATLGLIKASKSMAYIKGRDYVIPDDILHVIEPVLLHRLIVSPEARREKLSAALILRKLIGIYNIPVL